MRESKNQYFLKLAQLVATRGTCARRAVGCVIVNQHYHIKATGYNGVPSGVGHCIDITCPGSLAKSGSGLDLCQAIHAEQNALLQCDNVMGIYKMYCTTSPCVHCAKLIANTSCQEVIYAEEYTDTRGLDILKNSKIRFSYEGIIN